MEKYTIDIPDQAKGYDRRGSTFDPCPYDPKGEPMFGPTRGQASRYWPLAWVLLTVALGLAVFTFLSGGTQ